MSKPSCGSRHKVFAAMVATLIWSGCSMDLMPVHYSRVKSARDAERPIERGPSAPGAFRQTLGFAKLGGYAFDPARISIRGGIATLLADPQRPGSYLRTRNVIETSSGIRFTALDGFAEQVGPNHQGVIRYQLSNNSAEWFFHDGKKWTKAGPSSDQANSAADLKTAIKTFHSEVGRGGLFVRAMLVSPTGQEPVELKQFEVTGVLIQKDGWD
jgi:hypothetical protein